jgi:DNA repair protein RecN (Recombination protein N)
MLRTLEIRDILIIDWLSLEFRAGLNVLTGETGAGKSILLDALGFVLGWRGRADLVRQDASQGEVVAVFDVGANRSVEGILVDAGIPYTDELIIRRVNTCDGRKTAWINDRRVSGEVLRLLSDALVELHGQQDDKGLLNPKNHLGFLDTYARHDDLLARCVQSWRTLRATQKDLEARAAQLELLRQEEDFLRHSVDELVKLAAQEGEEAELDSRRRLMQAATRIRDDVAKASQALGLDGAEGMLTDASRWLDAAAEHAESQLDAPLEALSRALAELGEAQQGVERCLESLQIDPYELEQVEERLFAIRAVARKHGVLPDSLPEFLGELSDRLEALDGGENDLAGLERLLTEQKREYEAVAAELTRSRLAAAERLDKAIMSELVPLKMERARFKTEIVDAEQGASGVDTVTFTIATNPGAPAGPLNKVASGGELSRFLLALKVCLSGTDNKVTMIFDEIDRGVGGATADAVGRRLSSLGENGQVLVVTHSPQVAAFGKQHWRVSKRQTDAETLTTVVELSKEDRVDEIARMISGDQITSEARAAAKALLESAQ